MKDNEAPWLSSEFAKGSEQKDLAKRKPFVIVTPEGPDDGGDFGPHTNGTRTSGIQEAVDYAHQNCRDVYIWGGRGGMHRGNLETANIYKLHETLRIPWNQDFRLDGGNYVLEYSQKTGDAVLVDSQMNGKYRFGLIVSESDGAAVRLQPDTHGPDDFAVITASEFEFSAVCAFGTGILIDSSNGPIINNKVFAEETNTLGEGIHLTSNGSPHWISNNWIQVLYNQQYHARDGCTNLQIGDPGSDRIVHNRFELSLHAPRGSIFDEKTRAYTIPEEFTPPEDAIGVDLHAQKNYLNLVFYGKRAAGKDIIFEPEARENTIFAFNLPNGITNLATIPTNRIITNWPIGFSIETPAFPPSGIELVNTYPYSVEIIIVTPGRVKEWTITEAERTNVNLPINLSIIDNLKDSGPRGLATTLPEFQTISSGLFPGQTIILEPGEKVKFEYSKVPTWRWKGLR